MENETKTTVGNVCFVRNKEKKQILLLKRNREPMQHMNTGVGGKTGFDEDIYSSCVREVKEETGLDVRNIKLKGVVKTLLQGKNSAWILFVYVADEYDGELSFCDEGELNWVSIDEVFEHNLIGFIGRIMPMILDDKVFFEGKITHDLKGEVIEDFIIKKTR